LETGITPSPSDDEVGFGANTVEEERVLVLADEVDIDAPDATTEVHPRCVGALEDPWAGVVVFHDLVVVAGGTGRQEDEEDWVLALTALKSASFPRPEPGVKKVERSGVGIRVSMRRITCTLIISYHGLVMNRQLKVGREPSMRFLIHHLRIHPIHTCELKKKVR
jgi:hypothetical protein